ncbi:MAG: hypothetical protein OET90_01170 [Desulfuromonadales bacterium]|nr:hypothetical protein [Desulfuromonadales bacterium]
MHGYLVDTTQLFKNYSEISHKGRQYFITGRLDVNTVAVRTLDGKLADTIKIQDVLATPDNTPSKSTKTEVPLELVEDNRWTDANIKRKAIKLVFDNGEDRESVAVEIGAPPLPSILFVTS